MEIPSIKRIFLTISVLCPGAIRTPILERGGKYGQLHMDISPELERDLWEKLKPMPPDIFARKALDAIAKNKATIILPTWWNLIWWLERLSPSLSLFIAQKFYIDMQKKLNS